MTPDARLIERAVELAISGKFRRPDYIISSLVREGFEDVGATLNGPIIRQQLIDIMKRAAEGPERSDAQPDQEGFHSPDEDH